ncbi:MAG: SGNH/GDSL hydrolase family protein [Eubacteriales bacterium]|nr:SGNH/GDSL hydrolase family protein [Eubacteriales bacterium]
MLLEKGDILLMTGDSVTDVDRARPVGEGLFEALGKGYPSLVNALLGAVHPETPVECVNMGVSGNTSRHLLARWQDETLALHPDWVTCMIGINDIWRQFDMPMNKKEHVYEDEYAANVEKIIDLTLPAVKGMVWMTPFFMEPRREDPMRAMCGRYAKIGADIARSKGVIVCDTQAALDAVLAHTPSAYISWDRVHPNTVGHMALARALLTALEAL